VSQIGSRIELDGDDFFKKCHSFVKIVTFSYRGSELGLRSRTNPTLLGPRERLKKLLANEQRVSIRFEGTLVLA